MFSKSGKKDAKKRIAILTSGGDAPGMNAAIRAVVRSGNDKGFEVVGIEYGFRGLVEPTDELRILSPKDVSGIVSRGGTILYTARSGLKKRGKS